MFFISEDVMFNKNLSSSEKILMAYLNSQKDKEINLTNKEIAAMFGVTNISVSKWISNLKENGLIEIEQILGYGRIITIKE